ncbi:MAG: hypothetical protein HQ581_14030, partial [Planctomycetes bacterium]|nr:hypothetical protein [Planctomycetota bacterium]
ASGSYSGTPAPVTQPSGQRQAGSSQVSGEPDFSKMTPAEKARWNMDRWKRILG